VSQLMSAVRLGKNAKRKAAKEKKRRQHARWAKKYSGQVTKDTARDEAIMSRLRETALFKPRDDDSVTTADKEKTLAAIESVVAELTASKDGERKKLGPVLGRYCLEFVILYGNEQEHLALLTQLLELLVTLSFSMVDDSQPPYVVKCAHDHQMELLRHHVHRSASGPFLFRWHREEREEELSATVGPPIAVPERFACTSPLALAFTKSTLWALEPMVRTLDLTSVLHFNYNVWSPTTGASLSFSTPIQMAAAAGYLAEFLAVCPRSALVSFATDSSLLNYMSAADIPVLWRSIVSAEPVPLQPGESFHLTTSVVHQQVQHSSLQRLLRWLVLYDKSQDGRDALAALLKELPPVLLDGNNSNWALDLVEESLRADSTVTSLLLDCTKIRSALMAMRSSRQRLLTAALSCDVEDGLPPSFVEDILVQDGIASLVRQDSNSVIPLSALVAHNSVGMRWAFDLLWGRCEKFPLTTQVEDAIRAQEIDFQRVIYTAAGHGQAEPLEELFDLAEHYQLSLGLTTISALWSGVNAQQLEVLLRRISFEAYERAQLPRGSNFLTRFFDARQGFAALAFIQRVPEEVVFKHTCFVEQFSHDPASGRRAPARVLFSAMEHVSDDTLLKTDRTNANALHLVASIGTLFVVKYARERLPAYLTSQANVTGKLPRDLVSDNDLLSRPDKMIATQVLAPVSGAKRAM